MKLDARKRNAVARRLHVGHLLATASGLSRNHSVSQVRGKISLTVSTVELRLADSVPRLAPSKSAAIPPPPVGLRYVSDSTAPALRRSGRHAESTTAWPSRNARKRCPASRDDFLSATPPD